MKVVANFCAGLLLLWVYIGVNDGTNISATVVKFGRTCYHIENGEKRMFPDRYTLNAMGYNFHDIPYVDKSYINAQTLGPPLASLWDHHSNKALLSFGNSNYFLETRKVWSLLNPDAVKYKEKWIVSWRLTPGTIRIVVIPINSTKSSDQLDNLTELGLLTEKLEFPHMDVHGEDPRLFVLNEHKPHQKLYMIFCRRHNKKRPELRMAFTELLLSDKAINLDDIVEIGFRKEKDLEDQKNWSPFQVRDNELLFISSTIPHRIVQVIIPNAKKSWQGEGVTVVMTTGRTTSGGDIVWPHGELRGGTPAYLIPDYLAKSSRIFSQSGAQDPALPPPPRQMLSFFHSCVQDPPLTGSVLKTYTMGAYTFSASFPYGITAISSTPIVHDSLYSGPWANLPTSFYHIDYIAFPMGFMFSGDFVYLLYGRQDSEGWAAKINVTMLLDSLLPVNSLIFTNTSASHGR